MMRRNYKHNKCVQITKLIIFNPFSAARRYKRYPNKVKDKGTPSPFLEIVFVGQCEVFVCLLSAISFIIFFFSLLGREAHSLKKVRLSP